MRHFKTIFVSEVKLDTEEALLVDTRGASYKLSLKSTDEKQVFKKWFKEKFMNCVPQTVTMVELGQDCAAKLIK